jgi:hypothetical protein
VTQWAKKMTADLMILDQAKAFDQVDHPFMLAVKALFHYVDFPD